MPMQQVKNLVVRQIATFLRMINFRRKHFVPILACLEFSSIRYYNTPRKIDQKIVANKIEFPNSYVNPITIIFIQCFEQIAPRDSA